MQIKNLFDGNPRVLSRKRSHARKEHRCVWCGGPIFACEDYNRDHIMFEQVHQSQVIHDECALASGLTLEFPYAA